MANWIPLTRDLSLEQLERIQPAIDFVEGVNSVNADQANAVVEGCRQIRRVSRELRDSGALSKKDRSELFHEIALAMCARRDVLIGAPEARTNISHGEAFRRLCLTPEGVAVGYGMIELNQGIARNLARSRVDLLEVESSAGMIPTYEELLSAAQFGNERKTEGVSVKGSLNAFASDGLPAAVVGWIPEESRFSTYAYSVLENTLDRYIENYHKINATQANAGSLRRNTLRVPGDIDHADGVLEDEMIGIDLLLSKMFEDKREGRLPEHQAAFDAALKARINLVLETLAPRERDVMILRCGLEGYSPHTLDEVAQSFGLTRERIRLIEARALGKLRTPRREELLEAFHGDGPDALDVPSTSISIRQVAEGFSSHDIVVTLHSGPLDSATVTRKTEDFLQYIHRLDSNIVCAEEQPEAPVRYAIKHRHGDRDGLFVILTCADPAVAARLRRQMTLHYAFAAGETPDSARGSV